MHERKDKWSVGEWMTPNPVTVDPEMSVRAAFVTMRTRGFRHLLVAEDGKLVGVVTDRDLRRPDLSDDPEGWLDYYQLEDDYELRYVMTEDPVVVRPGDRIDKAVALAVDKKIGALPVVDKNGAAIGILSVHDLLRAFQTALAETGDVLRGD